MLRRFLSDLRDLWTLITQGQPEDDPLIPYRMVAELAKMTPPPIDWHKWEAALYVQNRTAFWFDPDRYGGQACDWDVQEKVKALTAYRDALVAKYGNLSSDKRFAG